MSNRVSEPSGVVQCAGCQMLMKFQIGHVDESEKVSRVELNQNLFSKKNMFYVENCVRCKSDYYYHYEYEL